jgi:hypothetical protein
LEGLPHVGIVIHDKNVRLIHFAPTLHPGALTERVRRLLLGLSTV